MSLLRSYFTKCLPQIQGVRRFSSAKPWQEVSIPVPWGQIRGKWWGPTDIRPVLTLHGWQDNSGSFDRLIPMLNKNVGFLSIDFPGHGLSSRLPAGIYYHFTNYLLVVKYIMNYFKWPKVSLMGHSMGGVTTYTYTMLYPQEVDFAACIDGAKPMIIKRRLNYMSKAIDQFLRNNEFAMNSSEPPSYTIDEIKQKVHAPNKGSVHLEFAHYIMERNIAPSKIYPDKYYFTRDPRLKSGELLNFSQTDLVENAQNITCPIFIAKATDASYYEIKENFYDVLDVIKRSSVDCDFHYIAGTHHVHLNNPQDELAGLLKNFIQRHNTEDRSVGGIKEECIVTEEIDSRIKDNSGSFDRLIPLLNKNVGFLAIDLPGHGLSSRLPAGVYYYFTNYVLLVKHIKEYFQWPKVSLLGHSMGGISSYVFTMLYPQTVDFVACIDGAKPWVQKRRTNYMAKALAEFPRSNEFAISSAEPPSYTLEEMKKKVHTPNNGSVNVELAHYILERNIAPSKIYPDKYYFTRDPRLRLGELLNFSQPDLLEQAQNMTCPIFIAKAKNSSYYEDKELYYAVMDVLKHTSADFDFHYVEGTHHVHLNNPEDKLAGLLKIFIERHNTEDRSIGGIKEDCIFSEGQNSNII